MKALRYKVAGAVVAALLLMLALAAGASATPTPSEIVIPAGYVATISNATFGDDIIDPGNCPANRMNYGYELDSDANVQLDSGVGCRNAVGATIGPFSTARQLRVYLDDFSCNYVFYSDGSHSLVTQLTPLSWGVSLMDSNVGCITGPDTPRQPVKPGTGNFNLTITLTPETPAALCTTTRSLVTGSPAYQSGWVVTRGYANLMVNSACMALGLIYGPPGPQHARPIALYDGTITTLVRSGLLSPSDGASLISAASVL